MSFELTFDFTVPLEKINDHIKRNLLIINDLQAASTDLKNVKKYPVVNKAKVDMSSSIQSHQEKNVALTEVKDKVNALLDLSSGEKQLLFMCYTHMQDVIDKNFFVNKMLVSSADIMRDYKIISEDTSLTEDQKKRVLIIHLASYQGYDRDQVRLF